MLKKKKHPKIIYAARINLVGLYSEKPIKCRLTHNEYPYDFYYGNNGEFIHPINTLGLFKEGGLITFTSTKKQDVELFLVGAKAARHHMSLWCQNQL